MFGLGMWELLIILAIVLVVFGAKKLPEIGAGLGKGISNFRQSTKESGEVDVTPDGKTDQVEDGTDNSGNSQA